MINEIYYLIILNIVTGFALYDIHKKRIPNKALVFFLPAAFAAPFITMTSINPGLFEWRILASLFLYSFMGSATGFVILLTATVISQNGNGVGGGDIKLMAVLGFIYGIPGIIIILLISSLLATLAGLYIQSTNKKKILRLPYVPFIAAGVLGVTLFNYM